MRLYGTRSSMPGSVKHRRVVPDLPQPAPDQTSEKQYQTIRAERKRDDM
jgi:hypothetical protein